MSEEAPKGPPPDLAEPITRWLDAARAGEPEAWERALSGLYAELKGSADQALAAHHRPAGLSPTMLVHDAWERLAHRERAPWKSRAHFLAIAARAMRGLLVDHLRAEGAERRGGQHQALSLSLAAGALPAKDTPDALAFEEALQNLRKLSERQAQIAELRLFAGLKLPEIAALLELGQTTTESEWRMARAWLALALG